MGLKEILSLIKEFLNVERELKSTTNQILIFQMLIPIFLKEENDVKTVPKVVQAKKSVVKSGTILEKRSESVEVINTDVINLCLEDVKNSWKDIVDSVKPLNTTLFAFLNSAQPTSVQENVLNIEVPLNSIKTKLIHLKAES